MNIDYEPGLWIIKKTDKNNKVFYMRTYSGCFTKYRMGRENAEFILSQHPEILIEDF